MERGEHERANEKEIGMEAGLGLVESTNFRDDSCHIDGGGKHFGKEGREEDAMMAG